MILIGYRWVFHRTHQSMSSGKRTDCIHVVHRTHSNTGTWLLEKTIKYGDILVHDVYENDASTSSSFFEEFGHDVHLHTCNTFLYPPSIYERNVCWMIFTIFLVFRFFSFLVFEFYSFLFFKFDSFQVFKFSSFQVF